jgi:hypothetical protein
MSYAFEQVGDVLRIVFKGTFRNHDLSTGGDEIERLEQAAPVVPHRISDMRPIERLEIDFAGVFELALRRRRTRFKNAFKSAIIATDTAHFGFARMYQTLNENPQITIAIFGDEGDARAWIDIPDLRPPEKEWHPSDLNEV